MFFDKKKDRRRKKTSLRRWKSNPRLSFFSRGRGVELEYQSRDLQIQGRERLRVRDLTESFFAYSQYIDSPESFILSIFTRKVSTVTFSEGGYTLSRSQNDKTSNLLITCFRYFDIIAETRSRMTTAYHVFPPK